MKLKTLIQNLQVIANSYGSDLDVHLLTPDDEHEIGGVECFHLQQDKNNPRVVAIYAEGAEE